MIAYYTQEFNYILKKGNTKIIDTLPSKKKNFCNIINIYRM